MDINSRTPSPDPVNRLQRASSAPLSRLATRFTPLQDDLPSDPLQDDQSFKRPTTEDDWESVGSGEESKDNDFPAPSAKPGRGELGVPSASSAFTSPVRSEPIRPDQAGNTSGIHPTSIGEQHTGSSEIDSSKPISRESSVSPMISVLAEREAVKGGEAVKGTENLAHGWRPSKGESATHYGVRCMMTPVTFVISYVSGGWDLVSQTAAKRWKTGVTELQAKDRAIEKTAVVVGNVFAMLGELVVTGTAFGLGAGVYYDWSKDNQTVADWIYAKTTPSESKIGKSELKEETVQDRSWGRVAWNLGAMALSSIPCAIGCVVGGPEFVQRHRAESACLSATKTLTSINEELHTVFPEKDRWNTETAQRWQQERVRIERSFAETEHAIDNFAKTHDMSVVDDSVSLTPLSSSSRTTYGLNETADPHISSVISGGQEEPSAASGAPFEIAQLQEQYRQVKERWDEQCKNFDAVVQSFIGEVLTLDGRIAQNGPETAKACCDVMKDKTQIAFAHELYPGLGLSLIPERARSKFATLERPVLSTNQKDEVDESLGTEENLTEEESLEGELFAKEDEVRGREDALRASELDGHELDDRSKHVLVPVEIYLCNQQEIQEQIAGEKIAQERDLDREWRLYQASRSGGTITLLPAARMCESICEEKVDWSSRGVLRSQNAITAAFNRLDTFCANHLDDIAASNSVLDNIESELQLCKQYSNTLRAQIKIEEHSIGEHVLDECFSLAFQLSNIVLTDEDLMMSSTGDSTTMSSTTPTMQTYNKLTEAVITLNTELFLNAMHNLNDEEVKWQLMSIYHTLCTLKSKENANDPRTRLANLMNERIQKVEAVIHHTYEEEYSEAMRQALRGVAVPQDILNKLPPLMRKEVSVACKLSASVRAVKQIDAHDANVSASVVNMTNDLSQATAYMQYAMQKHGHILLKNEALRREMLRFIDTMQAKYVSLNRQQTLNMNDHVQCRNALKEMEKELKSLHTVV